MNTADSSIQIPHTPGCAFCDYLAGRRPFTILERRELSAALITREQRGLGHVLVIPVNHRETVLDLNEAEGTALMSHMIRVSRAVAEFTESSGIAIWQNNGVSADQTIPHVHFHIAGTLPDGGTDWGEVAELSLAETGRIASNLRKFLP
ncbi:HIT family protein [Amycolatopsis sp. cmx-4-54]|uniref:HIT family protein n=1 Tax=Amycolatopsis sp. cmx-4-54 TaxID=2790936 RepID=UPI00397965AA